MSPPPLPSPTLRLTALCGAVLLALAGPVCAEKSDRQQQLNISGDKRGSADLGAQTEFEFVGHAILSQGSLVLKADRIVAREGSDGYRSATATSEPGQQITFSEKRDKPGSSVEGRADEVQYDERTDTIHFIGNAVVRLMQDQSVTQEVAGAELVYNDRTEHFESKPGASSPVPNERVRAVMMPRTEPPPAASAAATSASGVSLKASPALLPGSHS